MAGSVAEEVLSSIKTVKAFSGQSKETQRLIINTLIIALWKSCLFKKELPLSQELLLILTIILLQFYS